MEFLQNWILQHTENPHWILFIAILLAGINIPISIDVLIILAATLAATIFPEHIWHLYAAIFLGCYFSAWISFWMGRLLGQKLSRFHWFNKIAPPPRLKTIQGFYKKYGFLTLLIGRFIPFGVRNCIFMSSGMSHVSFFKFALWDLCACFVWSSLSFYCFFVLGNNLTPLLKNIKIVNISLFVLFCLAIMVVIWYKKKKRHAQKIDPS
jgi:membrane-associated protein